MDSVTKEIFVLAFNSRNKKTQALGDNLPPIYRECAVYYTDFWEAYAIIFTSKRHKSVDKSSGKTSYIEKFNNTQRAKNISVSQKNFIVFKKVKKSYWCCMVFCS